MAKNVIHTPEQLTQVLQMLSNSNNDAVKQGEKALKPFLKTSACLLALTHQVAHVPDVNLKLQAALLIKRRLLKLYGKLSAHEKQQLRTQLLHLLVSDQEKPVGIALAGCVSSLAKGVMVKDKAHMPELFQLLTDLSRNPNVRLRGLTYSLLAQLAENIPKQLMSHTATLASMLVVGCQDSESYVAVDAMRAATIYIQNISHNEVVVEMKPVLTPILNVLSTCLQNGDDSLVLDGLEVFEECCNMEYPLINDHIEVLVPFIINIIQADSLDYALKEAASTTFNSIIENRPKLIGKKQLVFPCLEAFVKIIAKSKKSAAGSIFSFLNEDTTIGNGNDDDDDDDDEDLAKVAQSCINVMALSLPSKYFVQPALDISSQCINSPDAHMRKAGGAVLGIITEGCEDAIKPLLPAIVPRLTVLCQDPDVLVRECASFALGQLSEYTQPDILHYANIIIPTILVGLDDTTSPSVQGTSAYVIEQFVENLEPSVLRPYLNSLIQKLVTLLQTSQKVSKEITLAAIAATAVSAEKDFVPYLDGVVNMLTPLMFLEDEKMSDVRGRALECLGHIAIAVGEEHFQRFFDLGMRSVMQATQMDNEALKEFGYIYVANIARATKYSFGGYLPGLIPHLLEVIGESELTKYVDEEDEEDDDDDDHNKKSTVTVTKASEDADEDVEDADDYELNVEEGFVNTKKGAITALGSMAQYTKELFSPFLQQSLEAILSESKGSFHSLHASIRSESIDILRYFVMSAKAATPEIKDYKPVKGVTVSVPSGPFTEVVSLVMNNYLRVIGLDEEKESVANALEGIVTVLEEIGQAALMLPCTLVFEAERPIMGLTNNKNGNHGLIADILMKQIYELLSEKAPCQRTKESRSHGNSHHDDLEDDQDHEKLVIDAVADVLGALPKFVGTAFIPYFDEFCKPLLKYSKPNRPYNDRSMVVGIFAEVILELGADSGKYVEMILPAVQASLSDPIEGVRRNGAFAVAAIVESHFGSLTQQQVMHFLQWLQPLFTSVDGMTPSIIDNVHVTSVVGADIDNALSAVSRMITKIPSLVPLAQVLPVMLKAMPLRVDPLEGLTVYGCIMSLITQVESSTMSLLPQILYILGVSLRSESKSITDETKDLIKSALRDYANPSHPVHGYIVNALQQIQVPEIQMTIQAAMS